MTDTTWYRIARDGKGLSYGPYSALSTTRNVASNVYGGSWLGVNSVDIDTTVYDWNTETRTPVTYHYKIQKLTAVLKPFNNGFPALSLDLEWIDLD